MNILDKESDCCGCEACFNICPVHAIEMQINSAGFWYPKIDSDLCVGCSQCREVCPVNHKSVSARTIKTLGGLINDEEQYYKCSSGGIFTALAQYVLNNNGYVCGAAYNDELTVEHICSNEKQIAKKIQGTKYVQSRINNNYQIIEDLLKKGETVLFSGTPCQSAGLICFLKKDYDNLVCVDLICHGVPSPGIWKKYLDEIQNSEHISSVNFREKCRGTDESYFVIRFSDGSELKEKKSDNLYMRGFLRNYFLRESCFNCHFKGTHRFSDITVGDFWGAKEYYPNDFGNASVSSIVIHTEKGLKYMENIIPSLKIRDVKQEEIKLWNECFDISVGENEKRDEFLKRSDSESILSLLNEYLSVEKTETKQSYRNHTLHAIRRILTKGKRILRK